MRDSGEEGLQRIVAAARCRTILAMAAVLVLAGCYEVAGIVDGTGDGGADVVGGPAPEFALDDLNPDSPTSGEVRSVSEESGKLLLVYFTNYMCVFCTAQLEVLAQQMQRWQEAGYGRGDLEMWSVGWPGQQEAVPDLLGDLPEGYDGVLMVDRSDVDAWGLYGADDNDLFLIDRGGIVVRETNLGMEPVTVPANLAALDALVRGLLD